MGRSAACFLVAEACVAELLGEKNAKLRSASGDYETEDRGNALGVFCVGGVSALSLPAADGTSRRVHRAVFFGGEKRNGAGLRPGSRRGAQLHR